MEVLDGVKVVWDFLFYEQEIGNYGWCLASEIGGGNIEKNGEKSDFKVQKFKAVQCLNAITPKFLGINFKSIHRFRTRGSSGMLRTRSRGEHKSG